MSTSVMAAVWPLKMPPVAKSVMVSLADNANDSGHCWPSIDTIADRTCFSRRAVIEAIKWLEVHGYLIPDRSNGRGTKYKLTPDQGANSGVETLKTSAPRAPVLEAHQCATRTNQCTTRTEPVRHVHTNRQEPSRTVNKTYLGELPDCIPGDAWQMFHEYRLKKSGKGWTEVAQKLAIRTLTRFASEGYDTREIIETSIERGYAGLFKPKLTGETHANHSSTSRNPSLLDRVAEKLRTEVAAAERVGTVHPANDADLRPRLGQSVR